MGLERGEGVVQPGETDLIESAVVQAIDAPPDDRMTWLVGNVGEGVGGGGVVGDGVGAGIAVGRVRGAEGAMEEMALTLASGWARDAETPPMTLSSTEIRVDAFIGGPMWSLEKGLNQQPSLNLDRK